MTVLRRTILNMYFLSATKVGVAPLVFSFVVALCSKSTNAQSVNPLPLEIHRPQVSMLFSVPVKRLCGRLQAIQKGLIVTAPKTRIKLYEAKWRKPCCKELNLVGNQMTAANGDFDFEEVLTGEYWLAVKWNGRENVIGIDLDLRHDWEGSCEAQGVLIEKNFLTWVAGRAIM